MKLTLKLLCFMFVLGIVSCKDTSKEAECKKAAKEEMEAVKTELDAAAKQADKDAKELEEALKELDNL